MWPRQSSSLARYSNAAEVDIKGRAWSFNLRSRFKGLIRTGRRTRLAGIACGYFVLFSQSGSKLGRSNSHKLAADTNLGIPKHCGLLDRCAGIHMRTALDGNMVDVGSTFCYYCCWCWFWCWCSYCHYRCWACYPHTETSIINDKKRQRKRVWCASASFALSRIRPDT